MRRFTRIILMLAVVLLSSSLVFSQGNTTIAQGGNPEWKDPSTIIEVPLLPEGSSRATGDDCTDPIVVSVPAALNYFNTNTTCGTINNYMETCLGSYSGGEDIIYRLDVTDNTTVNIQMNPKGVTWTAIGLFLGCPNTGTCISYMTGSSGTQWRVLSNQTLTAGNSYYIMIDTWPVPTCISSFDLTITNATPAYEPITSFPFTADYESNIIPNQQRLMLGTFANGFTSSAAAYNSSYGAELTSNNYLSWVSDTTGDQAFANNLSHIAAMKQQVNPSGGGGILKLKFRLKMTYTYDVVNYSWFRVTVNGTAISAENGITYPRPTTANGDAFVKWIYNLNAYQGLPNFLLGLESCGYYYPGYTTTYPWGDCSLIDNVEIFYDNSAGFNDKPLIPESFKINPNPSSSTITIELPPAKPQKNTSLTLYSLNGKQLLHRQITEPTTTLDISDLLCGVYFVKVTDDRTVQVGKFVKQ